MANQAHLAIWEQGIDFWNNWRGHHPNSWPDLSGADLKGAKFSEANLSYVESNGSSFNKIIHGNAELRAFYLRRSSIADLRGANLREANLSGANLSTADLSGANFSGADLRKAILRKAILIKANLSRTQLIAATLSGAWLGGAKLKYARLMAANLSNADLSGADLSGADLSGAKLCGADLSGADLSMTTLIGANLTKATLKDCKIYGISAWDIQLDGAEQLNLIITPESRPTITVDNLKIAQFIYLLLNNAEIRDVINTLTTKSVLILGRFTPERKAILDAIRDNLRTRNYIPLLFDFDQPISRDLTETVTTLARLARFIIADLTNAKSIPQELAFIVPHLPSVPVQPLLLDSQREYGMFEHFTKYPWVLPIHRYSDLSHLLTTLKEHVIEPAEKKAKELEKH